MVGHRHPGRPHRRAHAGGAAEAGVRRRRDGDQRHAAQRGRDAPQGRLGRRHGRRAPRRRRDPGGGRRAREGPAPTQTASTCRCAARYAARRWSGCRARPRRAAPAGLYCQAQRKQTLLHFAGRRAMDIEGLGDKLVDQLVEQDLVQSPADLYKLEVATLAGLERMAEKSAQNVAASIEQLEEDTARPLHLRARHPQRGRGGGEDPGAPLRRLDALLAADWASLATEKETIRKENTRRKKKGEPLQAVPLEGIGPELMESIGNSCASRTTARSSGGCTRRGVRCCRDKSCSKSRLQAKIFVLTGTLAGMSRDEAKARDRGERAQGDGLGVEEDRLRGRRRGGRQQARQGARARRRRCSTKGSSCDLLKAL